MKETQDEDGPRRRTDGYSSDRTRIEGTAERPLPHRAEASAAETGDYVQPSDGPGPITTSGSYVGGRSDRRRRRHRIVRRRSVRPDHHSRPRPASTTTGATASGGDRNATGSFSLDSRFDGPERTLPPSANDRVSGMPRSPVTRSWGCWARAEWGSSTRRTQVRLDRFVALKMIRAGAGAGPGPRPVRGRGPAVAAIEHPNIVRIFDIGEHGGMPYFSLEFLAGGNLAKKIGGKPQPVAEAARIVEILARAMDVAHQQRDHPPRPQAGQRPDRRRRHARRSPTSAWSSDSRATRARPAPARSWARPATWRPSRPWARPRSRAGRRPVCPGRDPLRAADRPAAVPGGSPCSTPWTGPQQGARAAVAAPAQDAPRHRDDLPEVPREGPGPPIRRRRRPGRGPAPVPGGRADRGTAASPAPSGSGDGASATRRSPPSTPRRALLFVTVLSSPPGAL